MTIHLAALTALSYYVKSASKEPAAPFLRPGPQKSSLSHEPDMPTNVGPLRWKWWKARHVTAKLLRCSKAFSGWLMLAYVGFCEALTTTSMPSSTPSTESLSTKLAKQAYATYPEKPQNPPKLRNASKLGIRTLCKNNRHTTVTGWHDLCQRKRKFQRSRVELQETFWPAMTCHDLPQVIHVSYPLPRVITIYYHILPVLLTSVLAGWYLTWKWLTHWETNGFSNLIVVVNRINGLDSPGQEKLKTICKWKIVEVLGP